MSKIETKMSVTEIAEYLSSGEKAAEFLHEQSIAKVDAVESIERYKAADGRKGFIMNLYEAGSEALSKLIIDIKAGQPSTDQVYDSVYGNGKECTKRVIVFTDEVDIDGEVNPTVDEYAVRSLVEAMNAFPLKLYLVNFKDDALHPELKEKDVFEDESPEF